jgi:hypothetical protein
MPARLAVPQTMVDSVSDFVANEGLPLTVVAGDDTDVRVTQSAEHWQSTATVLETGGRITCARPCGWRRRSA